MTAMIETVGLTCSFGGVVAVNDVTLAIEEGELRCLIGPNGAGKTSLFKCLTRQVKPSSGRVLMKGRDISRFHPHEVARMGMAIKMQVPSVFNGLSVYENVWLAASRIHKGKLLEALVDETLSTVGFKTREARSMPGNQLSHAHRQWLELGMLTACKPAVALLDEPAAGMTRDEMLRTVELIKAMNRLTTVLVVEHDLEFISLLARKVTVLHQGRVFLEDTMENISNNAAVREIYLGKQWRMTQ